MLLGHRDSVDFDFFCSEHFDTQKLYYEILDVFAGKKVVKVQEEKDTLTIIVDDQIKISFFYYPYPVMSDFAEDENLKIASIKDIGCMKLSAIVGRSVLKDYVDLYFILQTNTLADLLSLAKRKMPDLDSNLILKSLVYFADIGPEKIIFKNNNNVSSDVIKDFLLDKVRLL